MFIGVRSFHGEDDGESFVILQFCLQCNAMIFYAPSSIAVVLLYNIIMSCLALGAPLTDDVDVAVCTFEKANVLINQLLDEGRESRLSMVVVDELHLVSDAQRGFLLEVLLTKVLRQLCSVLANLTYYSC